jgi:hypothetical protein
MTVRFVWPISAEKINGYACADNKPRDNPALRIPSERRIVINGVSAFYEFVSHNAGKELRHPWYFARPTLSHQIRALETMLGAKPFARRTKSAVALTHSGKRVVFAGGDMYYLSDRRGDFSG